MAKPHLRRPPHPQPLVLVASANAPQRQALSDTLGGGGFRLTIAHDEHELIHEMHAHPPDAVVVDSSIGPPGFALCTSLRTFALATPIILTIPGDVPRASEHDALRAGAWAVLGTPTDAQALLLRLNVFIEPKRELDRVSEERLVDRVSGVYNPSGLSRRAAELAALANRQGLALACAVFRPDAKPPSRSATDRLALALRRVGRISDALGRTGRSEFAVFAPLTNTGAAVRLVRRLIDTAERAFGTSGEEAAPPAPPHVAVRAGYSAALAAQKISAPALLDRAREALEQASGEAGSTELQPVRRDQ